MKTLTPTFWLPPLLSLTLAACICFDDREPPHWEPAPPSTAIPIDNPGPNSTCRPACVYGYECSYGKCLPATGRPNADGGAGDTSAPPDGAGRRDGATPPDAGAVAIDGGCLGGNGGADGGGAGCGARPAPVCQFNNQCGPGGRCRDGACERPCQSAATCGTGHTCAAGFCQPPGRSGGQCVYDRDCGAGRTCINGFCHGRCQADTDCGAQDRCTGGVCKPDVGPQPECLASTDCADGKMCVNAVCRAACTGDAECCVGGVTGPTCRMGYCLSANESSPACRISADCAGGLSCTDAVCN